MNKLLSLVFCSIVFDFLPAQTTVTFEDLSLPTDSWWVGSDGISNGFSCNDAYFPTVWDTAFGGYWSSGFAYSNMTDSVTSGYLNMYSAKAGSGYQNSENYAITYGDGWFLPGPIDHAHLYEPVEMYITNNTFAYNNIRDGDAIGKKFGGVSGNDPDYFSVTFEGIHLGQTTGTAVTVYLADFRFEDNSLDYILSEWTWVDLSPLGLVDSVIYSFESSDVGDFGINTPLYFCMDNFKVNNVPNGFQNIPTYTLDVFPNPTSEFIRISSGQISNGTISIYSMDGSLVKTQTFNTVNPYISVSELANGMYFLRLNGTMSRTFVVQH